MNRVIKVATLVAVAIASTTAFAMPSFASKQSDELTRQAAAALAAQNGLNPGYFDQAYALQQQQQFYKKNGYNTPYVDPYAGAYLNGNVNPYLNGNVNPYLNGNLNAYANYPYLNGYAANNANLNAYGYPTGYNGSSLNNYYGAPQYSNGAYLGNAGYYGQNAGGSCHRGKHKHHYNNYNNSAYYGAPNYGAPNYGAYPTGYNPALQGQSSNLLSRLMGSF